jgi:hypothetical protein
MIIPMENKLSKHIPKGVCCATSASESSGRFLFLPLGMGGKSVSSYKSTPKLNSTMSKHHANDLTPNM